MALQDSSIQLRDRDRSLIEAQMAAFYARGGTAEQSPIVPRTAGDLRAVTPPPITGAGRRKHKVSYRVRLAELGITPCESYYRDMLAAFERRGVSLYSWGLARGINSSAVAKGLQGFHAGERSAQYVLMVVDWMAATPEIGGDV